MPTLSDIMPYVKGVPEGLNFDDIHVVECDSIAIEPITSLPLTHPVMTSGFFEASPPLINAEGRPTIMKVAAWMAHEGVNKNRQGFLAADLEEVASTLFREPNFGVMDFNHSAFRFFTEEPKVIGVWYSAEYSFDEAAQKHGILANGIMFSWLFPDHADKLLADQERSGHMRFSMACIPGSVELTSDSEGPFEMLHKPVFMTVSALDIQPADADALGHGSESTEDSAQTLKQKLLAIAAQHPWQLSTAAIKGDSMADSQDQLVQAIEKSTRLEGELNTLKAEMTANREELEALKTSSQTRISEFELKITELEGVNETLTSSVEELKGTITELTTERDELLAFKTETEAAAEEAEQKAKLDDRLKTLPARFVEFLDKKPAERKEALLSKIASMNDDEFTFYKEEELGFASDGDAPSYLERSRREGLLTTPEDDSNKFDIKGRIHKLLNN